MFGPVGLTSAALPAPLDHAQGPVIETQPDNRLARMGRITRHAIEQRGLKIVVLVQGLAQTQAQPQVRKNRRAVLAALGGLNPNAKRRIDQLCRGLGDIEL